MGESSRYFDCRRTEIEYEDDRCLGVQVLRAVKDREREERAFKLATTSYQASYEMRSWV